MDPELGRFVSMDPKMGSLSFSQTLNRYVYCINNPLRFTDSTGKFIPLVAAAIGAATGFLVSTTLYGLEVALTDKKLDWEEYAVEAVAGAVAGAIGGLLMNPGAGLAAKAEMKAALMGTKIAAKVGLKVTTKVMARVVVGGLTGLVTGPASYLSNGGLNTARGVDPQLTWSGLGRSAVLGALG